MAWESNAQLRMELRPFLVKDTLPVPLCRRDFVTLKQYLLRPAWQIRGISQAVKIDYTFKTHTQTVTVKLVFASTLLRHSLFR